ncbi:hypothetical protein QBC43DRAFT_216124 [Cladorrhinum sp. PSN259]|nr:hypothetical protein QBC43DRAFT_216124 [Cladorrhinum sp. PSN259]
MLSRKSESGLLPASLWLLLSSAIPQAAAGPFPKDGTNAAAFGYLLQRDCAVPCGYNNQYCCGSGSQCTTAAGIAGCAAWNFFTTTWTETRTYTKTWSSAIPAATGTNGADCVPAPGTGHIACGPICCAETQYCAYSGQCMANGGGVGVITTVHTGVQTVTTQFSAPYRVTSGTATSTGVIATQTGEPEEGTGGGGLSGGAIAGIVIGTILGVALLLLLCACCLVRGLWHGVLAIFGIGKKKDKRRSETIIEEERYTRRGSSHAHGAHSSWYGGRPSTVSSRKEKKKSSGAGMLGLGAAMGTMALLLGLKRDKNKKKGAVKSRSDISSSYYSDVYTADSPSSLSSDRRTRRSGRHASRTRTASRTTRTTTRISRGPSVRSQRSPR